MPRTTTASTSSIPLSASPMAAGADNTNHTFPFSAFQRHLSRLATDVVSKLDSTRRTLIGNASGFFRPPPALSCSTLFHSPPLFASTSHQREEWGKHAFDVALGADYISKTLAGTAVYTVSNSNNEFVLISDPNNSLKSLGLLCFRQEDAQALLAQVQLKQPVLGRGARVVPISLDQVYMLKVEGIAFRFLPDPLQIKNALELKSSNISGGFDGVPVFQSDVLVVRKKNRRYCPLYFQKEDIERELLKVPKQSRGSTQNIMVGSLEDVLKKMEMNDKNSGWDDLIFIPPGKSYSQHLKEVAA